MYEVDHLFVWVDEGAPEANSLVSFGLTEGPPNTHPGQGTANRRFFFRNLFLDLVWVSDPAEVQSELVQPTQLWSRWSQREAGASPFGVCFRPRNSASIAAPFPAWEYRPPYLPSDWAILIGEDIPLAEPLWFCIGFGQRPDAGERLNHQFLNHSTGFQEVTKIRLTGSLADNPSPTATAALQTGAVTFSPESEALLEMAFDGNTQGNSKDFRPTLPLIFRW